MGDYAEQEDPTFIIWFDNDGTPYDDPAIKVIVENSEISVEVEARDFSNNVTLQDYEIDRLEWWQGLHAGVLRILETDGKRRCPACGNRFVPGRNTAPRPAGIRNAPADTAKVVELANKRIQKLIACIAQGNRKLKRSLTEEYFIKL